MEARARRQRRAFIVNRLLENGAEVALDTQDTAAGGPSDPGNGSAVGTSKLDRSSSTGFYPAYSQKSNGGVLSDFVVTTLG